MLGIYRPRFGVSLPVMANPTGFPGGLTILGVSPRPPAGLTVCPPGGIPPTVSPPASGLKVQSLSARE